MRNLEGVLLGVAVVAFCLGLLLPLSVEFVPEMLESTETAEQTPPGPDPMEGVADAFARYHRKTGDWPCGWSGSTSSATRFVGFRCLGEDAERTDRWGHSFRVVFQAPTPRIPGAAEGAIALVSGGPDGVIATRDSQALQGIAAADDRVRLIARGVE